VTFPVLLLFLVIWSLGFVMRKSAWGKLIGIFLVVGWVFKWSDGKDVASWGRPVFMIGTELGLS
jgi:hypothetical protein